MRLLRGRSTPAIRAIYRYLLSTGSRRLALPLLVTRVLADHADFAFALDDFAVATHGFDRRSDFHDISRSNSGQDLGAALGHGHRVFKMRRAASIRRSRRPSILVDPNGRRAGIHHRLDREHHARRDRAPASPLAEVRHLGILVQRAADAVPYEIAHHRKTCRLGPLLHRRADVTEVRTFARVLDALGKARFGCLDQPRRLLVDFSDRHRHGRVREVTVDLDTEVETDDVALGELPPFGRNAVDDL